MMTEGVMTMERSELVYTAVAKFRMVFLNGAWKGKWISGAADFTDEGLLPAEREMLRAYCEWLETTFVNGMDNELVEYAKTHNDFGRDGVYFKNIEISDGSYVIAQYSTNTSGKDYPIELLLYRSVN